MPKGVYKRKPLTVEHKKNLSESLKGRTSWNKGLTKETDKRMRKMSESKKGKKNPNYGKHFSEEHRKNMSEARLKRKQELGYLLSTETRKKLSELNKGKHQSEESKKKIGDGNRGRIFSEEHKKKIGDGNRGKIVSEESLKKMSIAKSGENNPNWNPNREEIYAPYGENFYNEKIRNDKWDLQNGRDMLTGTILNPEKQSPYHHIDYDKSNDDPDNHCFLSINNHMRITGNQQDPIKSERYKKKLQANTLALKNGEIPKYWSQINKELFKQERLKQLDLSSYVI